MIQLSSFCNGTPSKGNWSTSADTDYVILLSRLPTISESVSAYWELNEYNMTECDVAKGLLV